MRGKLEVEGTPAGRRRRNLRATCRAEGAMLSALSAAGGARRPRGSRGAGGGLAASAAPGPGREHARLVGSGAIFPGGTTPAPDRQGRAGPRLPARAPPRLSSRRSPAPSTNQRGRKAGAGLGPSAPGSRGRPCSPRAPRDAVRRLRSGADASPGGRRALREKW